MKILFSGGGTLGSVMPLVAVFQKLKERHADWQFLWVGTKEGPERETAKNYGLDFKFLASAKWRRYFSWRNLADCFLFLKALGQSWNLIGKWQPDILISAGGFTSVPLHFAAWLRRRLTVIHQEDVKIGLANRLMSWFADFITVSFEINLKDFPRRKTILTGNPVRQGIFSGSKERAAAHFDLDLFLPTVLVLGGGTGALNLNKLIAQTLVKFIDRCQVIHVTGRGKEVAVPLFRGEPADKFIKERYHPVEFLEEEILKHALAAADLVITRAGLSTLSELAVLGKPMLILPLPASPQIDNASYFASRAGAPVFDESKTGPAEFVAEISRLLEDNHERLAMGHNLLKIIPPNAGEKMCLLIEELAKYKEIKNNPA